MRDMYYRSVQASVNANSFLANIFPARLCFYMLSVWNKSPEPRKLPFGNTYNVKAGTIKVTLSFYRLELITTVKNGNAMQSFNM